MSLLAYDSGLSYEKISLLFKKAMDSSSNIGDICVNIQKNLEYEISATKIESGGGEALCYSGQRNLPFDYYR
ncbi:MAG: hypothetical protein MUP69_01890 [Candidatus Atribacteria bacterium]|nr:hypothetical protein [Candidatus Atribacteria bacterium]